MEQQLKRKIKDISADGSFNIRTEGRKFNIVWTIKNFSLRSEKTGEKIISPTFLTNWQFSSEWSLRIYPKGSSDDSKEYVSVFLMLKRPDKAYVKVRFSILDEDEREKNVYKIDEFKDFNKNQPLGYAKFVKRDLSSYGLNRLLNNDKLTILCEGEIEYFNSEYLKASRKITLPKSKLSLEYGNMFDSSLFTDCIIKVEDTEIKVHKAVLAARSPVFHNILNSPLEESQTNVIEIKDFRVEVVREMLKYIYTDEVSNIQNMASEVLAIADKYMLDKLKAISEHSLGSRLTTDNVLECFALCETYSAESLKEYCLDLFLENAEWLTKTNEWKEFVLLHPLLVESLFIKLFYINSEDSVCEIEDNEFLNILNTL